MYEHNYHYNIDYSCTYVCFPSDCDYPTPEQVALCLRGKPAPELIAPAGLSPDAYAFIPVIDEHFISLHPLVTAQLGKK